MPDDVAGGGEVAEEEQEADGPREVEEPVRGHADAEREHETAEQHRHAGAGLNADLFRAHGGQLAREQGARGDGGALFRGGGHFKCDSLRRTHSVVTTPSSSRK